MTDRSADCPLVHPKSQLKADRNQLDAREIKLGLRKQEHTTELNICIDALTDEPGGIKRCQTLEGNRINRRFDGD